MLKERELRVLDEEKQKQREAQRDKPTEGALSKEGVLAREKRPKSPASGGWLSPSISKAKQSASHACKHITPTSTHVATQAAARASSPFITEQSGPHPVKISSYVPYTYYQCCCCYDACLVGVR